MADNHIIINNNNNNNNNNANVCIAQLKEPSDVLINGIYEHEELFSSQQ